MRDPKRDRTRSGEHQLAVHEASTKDHKHPPIEQEKGRRSK